ncbi:MAG: ATP-binding cassette domain-containing protein [Alsobacter sp.]
MNAAPPAGGSARLEVRIAEKTYPGADGVPVAALRDLTFSLGAGRIGALLGPSGGGKTTTLRIIAGLDPHFSGSVTRPGQGRLGIVFQEPRLLPWRTVEQNVTLAVEAAGLEGGGEAALYPLLGLENHRSRFPGELSLGLARRAAIARAFAVDPDLLLLDEPFVSLDSDTARRLRRELIALQARTCPTTILVTHDRDEALALADDVFVLGGQPGRIVAAMSIPSPREERRPDDIQDLRRDLDSLMIAERPAAGPE